MCISYILNVCIIIMNLVYAFFLQKKIHYVELQLVCIINTDQKIVDQKIIEQKIVDQKIVEQKIIDQKIVDQKIIDQKIIEQIDYNTSPYNTTCCTVNSELTRQMLTNGIVIFN